MIVSRSMFKNSIVVFSVCLIVFGFGLQKVSARHLQQVETLSSDEVLELGIQLSQEKNASYLKELRDFQAARDSHSECHASREIIAEKKRDQTMVIIYGYECNPNDQPGSSYGLEFTKDAKGEIVNVVKVEY